MIQKQALDTLKSLYGLMEKTRTVRAAIVKRLLSLQPCQQKQIGDLKNALASLKHCSQGGYRADLILDGSACIQVDLFYEISELEKDIFYLENGEAQFLSDLDRGTRIFQPM